MTLSDSSTLELAAPKIWQWKDLPITYQSCGDSGAAVLLIHGFGASWGHWRKNLPVLGASYHCYACLLYTSPSPRDLSTSRMPSSA